MIIAVDSSVDGDSSQPRREAPRLKTIFLAGYHLTVGRLGGGLGFFLRSFLPALDSVVDFLAVDRDFPRSSYTEPNLGAFDAQYGDGDIVADGHYFANAPREYQHV